MAKDFDLRKINGIRKKVINAINQIDIQQRNLTQKYMKKIHDEFDLICQSEIDKFYSSYTPKRYNRYGDLYNTYKILTNKYTGEFSVKFDSIYMKHPHRADSETIFINSFIEGYHGGAFCANNYIGEPHPDGHTPYWKNPLSGYLSWLSPAIRSESPYENILHKLPIKEKELQAELEDDFEKTMMDIITPIKNEINNLL